MHSCLRMYELIIIIAQYIKYSGSWKNADLLAFILTCHTICFPALDILWEELDDPHPLAYLFQSTVIVRKENRGVMDPQMPRGLRFDQWKGDLVRNTIYHQRYYLLTVGNRSI